MQSWNRRLKPLLGKLEPLLLERNPTPADLAARILEQLEPLNELLSQRGGHRLSLGIEGAAGRLWHDRFVLGPMIPPRRRVGIVSSRLGRNLLLRRPWFDALREIAVQLSGTRSLLVASKGAAGSSYVLSTAEIYHLPLLLFCPPRGNENDPIRWLARQLTSLENAEAVWAPEHERYDLRVSPAVEVIAGPRQQDSPVPLRDQIIWNYCDELFLLLLRRGGTQDRLLESFLSRYAGSSGEAPLPNRPRLWLADESMVDELDRRFQGRRGDVPRRSVVPSLVAPFHVLSRDVAPRLQGPLLSRTPQRSERPSWNVPRDSCQDYLYHWTRGCPAPWPGQTHREFVEQLLHNEPGCHHTALDTLLRILRERRLRGSCQSVRGETAVVSFTQVPLREWRENRVFRGHRMRWDFEPFGIAVPRPWLESLGARPVVYGDDETWKRLATEDRPFFQKRRCEQESAGAIDWTQEREWRICGDVELPETVAAFVFVPREQDILAAAEFSPWPVFSLDTDSPPPRRQ